MDVKTWQLKLTLINLLNSILIHLIRFFRFKFFSTKISRLIENVYFVIWELNWTTKTLVFSNNLFLHSVDVFMIDILLGFVQSSTMRLLKQLE